MSVRGSGIVIDGRNFCNQPAQEFADLRGRCGSNFNCVTGESPPRPAVVSMRASSAWPPMGTCQLRNGERLSLSICIAVRPVPQPQMPQASPRIKARNFRGRLPRSLWPGTNRRFMSLPVPTVSEFNHLALAYIGQFRRDSESIPRCRCPQQSLRAPRIVGNAGRSFQRRFGLFRQPLKRTPLGNERIPIHG